MTAALVEADTDEAVNEAEAEQPKREPPAAWHRRCTSCDHTLCGKPYIGQPVTPPRTGAVPCIVCHSKGMAYQHVRFECFRRRGES